MLLYRDLIYNDDDDDSDQKKKDTLWPDLCSARVRRDTTARRLTRVPLVLPYYTLQAARVKYVMSSAVILYDISSILELDMKFEEGRKKCALLTSR